MTGMQLVAPPGEESETSGDAAIQHQLEGDAGSPADLAAASFEETYERSDNSNVLSQELRDNFESAKSLWRQLGRYNNDNHDHWGVEPGSHERDLRRKQREKAVETAQAVDAEITKWQNGIAELEAMLAQAENQQDSGDLAVEGIEHEEMGGMVQGPGDAQIVRFPSLPPVVPLDEDEILSRSGSDTDSTINTTHTL